LPGLASNCDPPDRITGVSYQCTALLLLLKEKLRLVEWLKQKEHLPSKCEALSPNPVQKKKKVQKDQLQA
jgi:hypothetical protein